MKKGMLSVFLKRDYEFLKLQNRASALIFVIAALGMLALMSICFTSMANWEKQGTENYSLLCKARMIANSGMEYAVGKLRERYKFTGDGSYPHELYDHSVDPADREWLFWKKDPSPYWKKDVTIGGIQDCEDNIGAGVGIEDMDDTENSYPSFYCGSSVGGKRVSKLWSSPGSDEKHAITLKILDTTSQINLNMQMDPFDTKCPRELYPPEGYVFDTYLIPMIDILNNLSCAIASLSWYTEDGKRDKEKGPLRGLGKQIIEKRRELGFFRAKEELIGISDGTKTITQDDVWDIGDFITVYPGIEEYQENPFGEGNAINPNVYQSVRGYRDTNACWPYDRRDYRSPVNVNTASWPVLVAIFQGLKGWGSTIYCLPSITKQEAEEVASRVCQYRIQSGPFTSYQQWNDFLVSEYEAGKIFTQYPPTALCYKDGYDKVLLLNTMVNPSGIEEQLYAIPDAPLLPVYSTKALKWSPKACVWPYYTTEICFFPYGIFEITSLGELYSAEEKLLASLRISSVVKIYDLLRLNTQAHFDRIQTQTFAEKQENNAFPHRNNIQCDITPSEAARYSGYLKPTVCKPLWHEEISYSSGHPYLVTPENLRFLVDFNGSLKADYAKNGNINIINTPYIMEDDSCTVYVTYPWNVIPSENVWRSLNPSCKDYVPCQPLEWNENDYYYKHHGSKIAEGCSVTRYTCVLAYTVGTSNPQQEEKDNLPTTQGTLSFWFKPHYHNAIGWPKEWRNFIFTTNILTPQGNCKHGVQMEISMNNDLFTKNLQLQVRRKYCQLSPESSNPIPCPYQYVDHGIRIQLLYANGYGVRANEWYHLAVRWQNGTRLDGFPGPAIVVSGNFYGKDASGREKVMHSGPAIVTPLNTYYDSLSSWTTLLSPKESNQLDGLSIEEKAKYLAPLEKCELDFTASRMYLGTVYRYCLTNNGTFPINDQQFNFWAIYDNIRISTYTDWDPSLDFNPTIYLWKNPLYDTIADFQGQIPEIKDAVLGPYYCGVRGWKSHYQYNENPFYTLDMALPVRIEPGNRIYAISQDAWRKLWWDATKQKPPKDWWQKLTGQENPKAGDMVKGTGSLTAQGSISAGTSPLWQFFLDYYYTAYEGADPLGLNLAIKNPDAVITSAPMSLDPEVFDYATRKYSFKFRAPASSMPVPLYQSPIVEEFILSYQKKWKYLSYNVEKVAR